MRANRGQKRPSRAQGTKAETFWNDRTRKHHIKVGDSLIALEAKLAAIKPQLEVVC